MALDPPLLEGNSPQKACQLAESISSQLSLLPSQLVDLGIDSTSSLPNWHSMVLHPTRWVVWTTHRVNLHPMNTFYPRLAELLNNSSSSMKIALDSPSTFVHSPSPMNFHINGLVQNVGSLPGDPLKTFPHSTGSFRPSTEWDRTPRLAESKNGLAKLVTSIP